MKLLGAVLILGGAALQCHALLAARRRERAALRQLSAALEELARAVRVSLTPLPRLLAQRGRGEWADAFFAAVLSGGDDAPLPERWRAAAESVPLAPREREVIRGLADALGSDESALLCALHDAARELRGALAARERVCTREGRLATALSVSFGLLLTILLF